MRELRELRTLTDLDLCDAEITDTGFKELRELKNLTTLNLAVPDHGRRLEGTQGAQEPNEPLHWPDLDHRCRLNRDQEFKNLTILNLDNTGSRTPA